MVVWLVSRSRARLAGVEKVTMPHPLSGRRRSASRPRAAPRHLTEVVLEVLPARLPREVAHVHLGASLRWDGGRRAARRRRRHHGSTATAAARRGGPAGQPRGPRGRRWSAVEHRSWSSWIAQRRARSQTLRPHPLSGRRRPASRPRAAPANLTEVVLRSCQLPPTRAAHVHLGASRRAPAEEANAKREYKRAGDSALRDAEHGLAT